MFSREFVALSPIGTGISPGLCRVFPRSSPIGAGPDLPISTVVVDTGLMQRIESDSAARPGPALGIGLAVEDWTGDARFYEYSAGGIL